MCKKLTAGEACYLSSLTSDTCITCKADYYKVSDTSCVRISAGGKNKLKLK